MDQARAQPPKSISGEGPHEYLRRAASWVRFHCARSEEELKQAVADELDHLLPDIGYILAIEEDGGSFAVEAASQRSTTCAAASAGGRRPAPEVRFPLLFGPYEIGRLELSAPPDRRTAQFLEVLLLHYAAARVNLVRWEEAARNLNRYCSSLKAFEEGVVLFQEQNPDAMSARLLQLCMQALGAVAGAVYVHERVDDPTTPLVLDQAVGLPPDLLERVVTEDGRWWPGTVVSGPPVLIERTDDGVLPGLDSERVPGPLANIVAAPLAYHGVKVGLCVLCNVASSANGFTEKLASSQRLFELGAAVLHRRELERRALVNRELQTQLQIASVMQHRLIPRKAPEVDGIEFAWRSEMSQQVGGDYLDIFRGDADDVCGIIADVSGHGVNSALLMTSFRASYRSEASWLEPEILLTALNAKVRDEIEGTGMFLTAACIRLVPEQRKFHFASAGHNPVFLFRPDEDRFFTFEASGPPLGMFPGITYEAEQFQALRGDILVLYTDGVVEAQRPAGEHMFGEEGLKTCIRSCAAQGAEAIVDGLYRRLDRWTGSSGHSDDVSVLVIRFV